MNRFDSKEFMRMKLSEVTYIDVEWTFFMKNKILNFLVEYFKNLRNISRNMLRMYINTKGPFKYYVPYLGGKGGFQAGFT